MISNNKTLNINASVDLFYLSTELKEQENILISNGIYEIKRTKCINSGFNEIGSGLCANYSLTGDFIDINGLENFNNQLENQTIIISTNRTLNFQIPICRNNAATYCSGANQYSPGTLTIKKIYN